jgi:two-component sensor histidine kinase
VRCDRLPGDTADVVLLLTSELVTNAVLYGAGDALLDIQVETGLISVGVADGGGGDVRAAERWRWPEGGHGLTLVQALANRWGVEPDSNGTGKRVWFEVAWQMTGPAHRAGSAASTA